MRLYLPLVPCNGIQDSLGFWIQHRGFRILGTGPRVIRQWNLASGFQSGFLELYRGFQSPGLRIPQEKFPRFWIPQAKISRILESGIPYMGLYLFLNYFYVCNNEKIYLLLAKTNGFNFFNYESTVKFRK